MKSTLIVFLICLIGAISAKAATKQYNSCCVCIEDPSDKDLRKICKKWFLKQGMKNNCSYKTILPSFMELEVDKDISCKKLNIYGAFHALSSHVNRPFEISKYLSEELSSKEVVYNGESCLLFNNTSEVKEEARQLANTNPDTKFTISGNQNIGLTEFSLVPIYLFTKELEQSTSKMTVSIEKGKVSTKYNDCTKTGYICGVSNRDGNNDPDTKYCMHEGKLTTQSCCQTYQEYSQWSVYGKWDAPGQKCGVKRYKDSN